MKSCGQYPALCESTVALSSSHVIPLECSKIHWLQTKLNMELNGSESVNKFC